MKLAASGRRTTLDKRAKRFILWAKSEEASPRVIAELLGLHPSTVKRFLAKARSDPRLIVAWGFVARVRAGRERVFVCQKCGMGMKDEESAGEHGFEHVWGEELLAVPPNERARYLVLRRGSR